MPFSHSVCRAILLLLIGICHIISGVLASKVYYSQTHGVYEAVAVICNFLTLLTLLAFVLHRWLCDGESGSLRSLITFSILWFLGAASGTILTIRSAQEDGQAFCLDFSLSSGACSLGLAMEILDWVSIFFAFFGMISAYVDKHSGAVKVTPRFPPNKAPSSAYPPQVPIDLRWDCDILYDCKKAAELRLSDKPIQYQKAAFGPEKSAGELPMNHTTYNHWTTVPV